MHLTYKLVLLLGFAILRTRGSNEFGNSSTEAPHKNGNSTTEATHKLKADSQRDFEINAEINSNFPEVGSMQCGEALLGSSGTISYKPYSPISGNERCVWTIRTRNATRYRFTVTNLGTPRSVIITTVTTSGSLSHFVPTAASSSASIVTGTLVVITFYSTSATGRGFSLTYDTYALGGNHGSTSREVVAASNIGHIKHPLNVASYANNDLSAFVFVPSCINEVGKSTQIIYIKDALEGTGCNDKLLLYRFDVTYGTTSKWRSIGQICGNVNSEVITSPDLMLVVFRSDGSVVNSGFHLYSSSV